MKFTEGSVAFLVESNIQVRRVVVVKATRDFYTVSFCYDDFDVHGAIRVRHNRLYASKKEAEAAIEERESRRPKTPSTTPKLSARHKTHWDYMM